MAGTVALAAALLLGACSDDTFREGRDDSPWAASDHICFGISETGTSRTTRAAGGAEERTTGNFVLRGEGTADTLCMRAYVTDGIEGAALGEKGAATRAAQVTAMETYGKFRVLAYWKKNDELVTSTFFMNETVNYGNNGWSTEKPHYWPGSGHKLSFYAWAPASITGPEGPESHVLEYEVPNNVNDVTDEQGNVVMGQKDVVVAVENDVAGDSYKAVQLKFDHICTAVRFVVGGEMQAGTIERVTLKNIKYKGTYDMSAGSWIFSDEDENKTKYFSQELDKATTAGDAAGTAITDEGNGYFMMLPQKLGEGAAVEVVFTDAVTGNERTLSASIEGQEWKKGTTVTYKLSITPDYELEFVSSPEAQDAHYVIYPITIKAANLPEGGWTLKSNDEDNVTFVENFADSGIKDLVDQGYWLKDYCGESTLTSSSSGEVQIYVFLKENISEKDRGITLSLTPANNSNAKSTTFAFEQYCPAWNNDIGVERIQEKDYPWGFSWSSNMKITYAMPRDGITILRHALFTLFGDHTYVSQEGSILLGGIWKVTVNFSEVPKLTTATSSTDGITNTWELYTFEGINEASTIMAQLESWGGVPDKTLPENPSEFAAWACAKKNIFGVETKEESGNIIYKPILTQTDMVWYLPAQEEALSMKDSGMLDNYWTSTAITDDEGDTAYKYTAGGSTSPEDRNSSIHVRAVRKKPVTTE